MGGKCRLATLGMTVWRGRCKIKMTSCAEIVVTKEGKGGGNRGITA
jgi:hypothetical protein